MARISIPVNFSSVELVSVTTVDLSMIRLSHERIRVSFLERIFIFVPDRGRLSQFVTSQQIKSYARKVLLIECLYIYVHDTYEEGY